MRPQQKILQDAVKTQGSQIHKLCCRKQSHYGQSALRWAGRMEAGPQSQVVHTSRRESTEHVLCISTKPGKNTSMLWLLECPGAPVSFVSLPDAIYKMWTGRVSPAFIRGPPGLLTSSPWTCGGCFTTSFTRCSTESVCRVLSAQIRSTRVSWDGLAAGTICREEDRSLSETTKMRRTPREHSVIPAPRRREVF